MTTNPINIFGLCNGTEFTDRFRDKKTSRTQMYFNSKQLSTAAFKDNKKPGR